MITLKGIQLDEAFFDKIVSALKYEEQVNGVDEEGKAIQIDNPVDKVTFVSHQLINYLERCVISNEHRKNLMNAQQAMRNNLASLPKSNLI